MLKWLIFLVSSIGFYNFETPAYKKTIQHIIKHSEQSFDGKVALIESIIRFNPYIHDYLNKEIQNKEIKTYIFWQGNDFEDHTKYVICLDFGNKWEVALLRCQTNGIVITNKKIIDNRDNVELFIKKMTIEDNKEFGIK